MKKKPFFLTIFICIIISFIFIGICISHNHFNHQGNVYSLKDNWYYSINGKIPVSLSLPTHIDHYFKKGDVVDLYTHLPLTSIDKPYLYTSLYLQYVEIYLDGKMIYQYGSPVKENETVVVGSGYICIPLPENYTNSNLHIRYIHTFNHITNYLFPITLRAQDLKSTLIYEKAETLYANSCFFICGLLCIGIGIYWLVKRQPFLSMFLIGLFGLNASVWFLCNTKCIQLFTSDLVFVHNLEYFCFYLLCIPLWLFFYINVSTPFLKKYCLTVLIPFITFFIGASILNFCNVVNYFQLLTFYHILLITSILLLILLICFFLYQHHPLGRGLLIGILALTISGVLELIKFYSTNIPIRSFFNYGIIIFFISISVSLVNLQQKPSKTIQPVFPNQIPDIFKS